SLWVRSSVQASPNVPTTPAAILDHAPPSRGFGAGAESLVLARSESFVAAETGSLIASRARSSFSCRMMRHRLLRLEHAVIEAQPALRERGDVRVVGDGDECGAVLARDLLEQCHDG